MAHIKRGTPCVEVGGCGCSNTHSHTMPRLHDRTDDISTREDLANWAPDDHQWRPSCAASSTHCRSSLPPASKQGESDTPEISLAFIPPWTLWAEQRRQHAVVSASKEVSGGLSTYLPSLFHGAHTTCFPSLQYSQKRVAAPVSALPQGGRKQNGLVRLSFESRRARFCSPGRWSSGKGGSRTDRVRGQQSETRWRLIGPG